MAAISKPHSPRVVKLEALRPDPRNARRRTERSSAMIERSLSVYGAARSIVVDEDSVVLAGNGTVEAAASIGIERVLVVPADGNTLVAVQRTDLTPRQKREYAIADNRASDLSEFDGEVLAELIAEDPDLEIDQFFSKAELEALLNDATPELEEEENGGGEDQDENGRQVKLTFERDEDFETFLQSLSQLAAALPDVKTTEERLQLVLDRFLVDHRKPAR